MYGYFSLLPEIIASWYWLLIENKIFWQDYQRAAGPAGVWTITQREVRMSEQKLREFCTSKPALQQILKDIL